MVTEAGIVLGFDPGGKTEKKFGWSVCCTDGSNLLTVLKTGLGGDAEDVIGKVRMAMESHGLSRAKVLAVGIDAPMFWGKGGNRQVECIIREALKKKGISSRSVQEVNSLQGACLVQGLVLANRLYAMYKPKITETHPKVLLCLLAELKQDGYLNQLIEGPRNEHERDAVISAYAAWAMLNGFGGWRDIHLDEPDPVLPFDIPVSYWMPIG